MDKQKMQEARAWIRAELDTCTKFWIENGIDRKHGGVYTCLDRYGKIYSTDKSVWMQGRCAWTYSFLCARYGKRAEWMEAAESCLEFLEKYCLNKGAQDRLYFTVTEDGKPLRQRRYFASEAFYSMANAEYYGITGKKEHLIRARRAYDMYFDLWQGNIKDPTGLGPKGIPETRTGAQFHKYLLRFSVFYLVNYMLHKKLL